jgi:phospholipid transport system substrate-binding protein
MLRLAAALALVVVLGSAASAAPTPTETLRQVFTQADRILTDPETEDRPLERLSAVRKLVNDALDFREAAALTLGRHWQTATPVEQHEFTKLLAAFFERTYLSRLASQASLTGGVRIRYLGESIDGGEALVRTAVARRAGGEIRLDYRMVQRGGRWSVRDVIVDAVSVAANYRAQIARVLHAISVPELLAQMRERVGRVDALPTASVGDTPLTLAVSSVVLTATTTDRVAAMPVTRPLPSTPAVMTRPAAMPDRPIVAARPSAPVDPAPPTATATPSRAFAAVTKAYWLRLGTFTAVDDAVRLIGRLPERNLVVALERTSGAVLLSVRIGPYREPADAVRKLLDLQRKGHDPVLFADHE